jgi:hypothetical protein
MGGSGKRQLADGSAIYRHAIGKLRRLRLPLSPDIPMNRGYTYTLHASAGSPSRLERLNKEDVWCVDR